VIDEKWMGVPLQCAMDTWQSQKQAENFLDEGS
jgi:hypothetical protein